jgi:aminopeptidase-like protein
MMMDLIHELWFLRRDIVSDGYDQALQRLAQDAERRGLPPMSIHAYPSGEACWTWRVPEKWTCDEAYLETLDGQRLLDYADHPLYVVSYSLPFEGVVSRQELLEHLHVHPRLPDAIPFVFKYYERDWGLCCPQILRDTLTQDAYRVVIRTRFEPGQLKVGEIVLPGESEQSFVLAAHLCHPGMVNDDLSGVVVGLEAMTALNARPRRCTYRLLILPETIGSVAYLSHHEHLIPKMAAGLFLEMLGNASPHALQGSFQPDSQADRTLRLAFSALDSTGYQGPYRGIIDNDERQFNAPGVRVPMLSLSRVEALKSSGKPPYREYHSSLDTPEIVSQQRLEDSCRVVLGLLDAWERNTPRSLIAPDTSSPGPTQEAAQGLHDAGHENSPDPAAYVVNRFKGEIFCSGYGIWIDYRLNPQGHSQLFQIMERCDGEHSVADIAAALHMDAGSVWEVVLLLHRNDLVSFSQAPQPTDPHRNTNT